VAFAPGCDRRLLVNYLKARQLADAWVAIVSDERAVIVNVSARPYGWVFFWESKRFLETNKTRDRLAGNAPILVDRIDGEVRVTGTAQDFGSGYDS
jgi:Immunity protein 35